MLGDLLAFLVHSPADFYTILGEMTLADKKIHPQHFGTDPADIRIRKSGFESHITFWPWRSLRSLSAIVFSDGHVTSCE